MGSGPGIRRAICYCRACKRNFRSCREDAITCSVKCRKAWNRLMGGGDGERSEPGRVTDLANVVYRVLLDGRHVASYPSRDLAGAAIAGWLREWDGEFTVQAVIPKRAFPKDRERVMNHEACPSCKSRGRHRIGCKFRPMHLEDGSEINTQTCREYFDRFPLASMTPTARILFRFLLELAEAREK